MYFVYTKYVVACPVQRLSRSVAAAVTPKRIYIRKRIPVHGACYVVGPFSWSLISLCTSCDIKKKCVGVYSCSHRSGILGAYFLTIHVRVRAYFCFMRRGYVCGVLKTDKCFSSNKLPIPHSPFFDESPPPLPKSNQLPPMMVRPPLQGVPNWGHGYQWEVLPPSPSLQQLPTSISEQFVSPQARFPLVSPVVAAEVLSFRLKGGKSRPSSGSSSSSGGGGGRSSGKQHATGGVRSGEVSLRYFCIIRWEDK